MVLPPETTLPDLSEVQHMKLDIVVDFELDCIGILPMSYYRCLAVELCNGEVTIFNVVVAEQNSLNKVSFVVDATN